MSRHLGREIALQALFQLEFLPDKKIEDVVAAAAAEHDEKYLKNPNIISFAKDLIKGVLENLKEIDFLIEKAAKGWKIVRMGYVEKNIMRISIYEIKFAPQCLPASIAVNEAVELAKHYCDEDTPKFVNGVMGTIAESIENK